MDNGLLVGKKKKKKDTEPSSTQLNQMQEQNSGNKQMHE